MPWTDIVVSVIALVFLLSGIASMYWGLRDE